ncbi:hypothetical protein P3X46_025006 [Hevea brasiliensis]|uniref:Cyclase family protein n=1 Tax=Hevea brasiliensis TaxID=3981 RepID=A0ABQ9L605_HEVBR|nr:hypothetical protein P3X46_025006 [Hevea brasiliensis]
MAAGTMRRVQLMLLLQLCPGILTLAVRSLDEGVLRIAVPERREVYNNGKIYDITHLITPEMSKWGTADGMGQVVTVIDSIKNGPALVVDVPRDSNISAKVMKSLQISKGVHRVLFRTLNTDRKLMYQTEFDSNYVGIVKDGAQWIVENTDIKLVGIDFLSIATYDDAVPTHQALLRTREIVVVEGLKLEDIEAGIYDLHCLPIKVLGAHGTPTRCILME